MRLLYILCLLCLFVSMPARADDTLKVGVLLPFTGYKEAAFASQKAFDLAAEEINNNGGILGKKIEIIYRDDKGDPSEAIKAVEDLVLNENIKIIMGTIHDHVKLAVSDYAKRNKVLFICTSGGSDNFFTEYLHDYAFRLGLANYVYVQALAEAAAQLPAQRWAAIAPAYEYGFTFIEDFKKYLKALRPDVEFVYEQFSPTLKLNGGASIQAIASKEPDAIVTGLFGSDIVKFVREGKKRNLFDDVEVISALTGMPEELEVLGEETPIGWITLGYPYNQIEMKSHNDFLTEYRAKYSEDPKAASVYTYIGMHILGDAINKAKSTSPEDIANAIDGSSFETMLGKFEFDKNTNQLNGAIFLGKTGFIDGKPTITDWKIKNSKDYAVPEIE